MNWTEHVYLSSNSWRDLSRNQLITVQEKKASRGEQSISTQVVHQAQVQNTENKLFYQVQLEKTIID